MKNLITLICLSLIFGFNTDVFAQESQDLTERHPVYDYEDFQLSDTDTIPGFESKPNKLKISGTIYESDGVTPANGVILYIEQADEHGDFDLRKENGKRYVHNRGWVKTDANGQYTFYTYIPGNDRRYNQLQQLFPVIKESSKEAYEIESFLFDEDPLLSKICRKKITKKGDPSRILKPTKVNDIFVVQKDITLYTNMGIAVSN